MSTLSFDLRGFAPHAEPLARTRTREAGASLLMHAAGITALTLIPLLGSTPAPETANAFQEPLVKPVTVSLPPAPRLGAAAPRRSHRAQSTPAVARDLTPPSNVPALITLGDVLDPVPGSPSGESDSLSTGDGRQVGGDCALGAMCGPGLDPAPSPTPATIVRIGGLIREPRLLEGRAPQYPPIAQAAGVSGKVVIEAHVAPNGRILDLKIVEGHPLFDEAALASVRSRRYEPLLLNGVPTDFLITITVAFNMRR